MRPTPSVVNISDTLIGGFGYDTPVTHHNAPVTVSTPALEGCGDRCAEMVLGHRAHSLYADPRNAKSPHPRQKGEGFVCVKVTQGTRQ